MSSKLKPKRIIYQFIYTLYILNCGTKKQPLLQKDQYAKRPFQKILNYFGVPSHPLPKFT